MKHKYILFAASLLALSANAQETYENAKLAQEDLNGTARYVGMGGAMEALGADISTIGTNPAGIGLFRHSTVNVSGGLVMQGNGQKFANSNKTNASFDQVGFVYSTRSNRNSFLNFGVNYHKGKNFDYILNAANALSHSSQNKQSYIKGLIGDESQGGFYVDKNKDGEYIGYANQDNKYTAYPWSQTDYLYWNTVIPDSKQQGSPYYYDGTAYKFDRTHTGYIGNYDFNISGNLNDRVYLGLTFGLKDVHYKAYSEYNELLSGTAGSIFYSDSRRITGSGFDVTAGIIVRPIETSPFRIGAYVKSPTWYDLTTENTTYIHNNTTTGGVNNEGRVSNSYDYKIWTPWKFGFSIGHTIGNFLALGATYEYEDYAHISTRLNDGGYYDSWYGEYYESTKADKLMNNHTKNTLKGVSTLKLGLEYKPFSNVAIRMGYNYVSPMYVNNAQKDPGIPSLGTSYSSTTDYTNWKATNRFTLGLGYQVKKFNIDLAYQYSSQKGDFYPFSEMYSPTNTNGEIISNFADATKVDNNRSQLILTLGYHF